MDVTERANEVTNWIRQQVESGNPDWELIQRRIRIAIHVGIYTGHRQTLETQRLHKR